MLLPFDFAVITAAEAKLLMEFIEKQTATKSLSRNYDKMQKLGVLELYNKLREFVEAAHHYEWQLRGLDTGRFITDPHYD
jgi:hypothetical protein